MKTIILTVAIAIAAISNSIAQWTKISAIPTQDIVALAVYDDSILAASNTGLLYKSGDDGVTWKPIMVSIDTIDIITLKVIDYKIYIGTSHHGIFCSADGGLTWLNTGGNLLPVSQIAMKENDLYASTLGNGVYIFNQDNNSWLSFNNSLPTYSVNVFTILSTSGSLLIGAGANGTFYRYDFDNSQWNEEYYYGSLKPGLLIDKLIVDSNTMFAINGNRIIRSDNDGMNWMDDSSGSHDGYSRNIYPGINNYYSITNVLTGGTWIQYRSKLSPAGSTWKTNEEFLPNGYSYDILEFKNKLFLAKTDGLYVRDLTLGIDHPEINELSVKIYPNPSTGTGINILSDNQVHKLTIRNTLGQIKYSAIIDKSEFRIQPDLNKGAYFINLNLLSGQNIADKIIIE
jgi:hypothetical protein